MHYPLGEEHLLVLAGPDVINCGDKSIVEKNYNKKFYAHPANVQDVALTPNGGLRFSLRLPEGLQPETRADICERCYTRILWNVIGRLKNKLDSLEHRIHMLENPHSRFTDL